MGWMDWITKWGSGASAVVAQEAYLSGLDYEDPDINLPVTGGGSSGFRRLTQSSADLSILVHERMQAIALHLYDRNPLAKGIIDLVTCFVVGEGITATSKDEDVQKTIDRFWSDEQNEWEQRAEDFTRELGIYGEQCLLAFVNEKSGRVAVVSADPRTIKGVVPDPLASDRAFAVCFSGGIANDDRYVRVIHEDGDPTSPTFGLLVGAAAGETFQLGNESRRFYEPIRREGEDSRLVGCFFFTANKVRAALRGRSDLLPIADFVDLYDRLLFDEAERMSFLRAFLWIVQVKGMDAAALQKRAAAEPPPKPGSVKFVNESETWKAESPALGSQESATTADLILSHIATGAGLPKHWLNGIMDVNRATAESMGDPALKRLAARQKLVIRAIRRVLRFALDQAEIAGALKPADDGRHAFEISAPEMSSRDLEKAARSLFSTVQALGMADAANWVDDETAQQVLVMMLGQLGVDITMAELRERIEQQAEEDAENDQYEVPVFFGVGKHPGSDETINALNGTKTKNGSAPQMTDVISAEAFDESKIVRGPGGKFGSKPDSDIAGIDRPYRNADQRAADEKAAKAAERAAKKAAKASAKGAKGGKVAKPKPLTRERLAHQISGLHDGDSVSLTVLGPDGKPQTISGTIKGDLGGMPVLTFTSAGGEQRSVLLHDRVKNVVALQAKREKVTA